MAAFILANLCAEGLLILLRLFVSNESLAAVLSIEEQDWLEKVISYGIHLLTNHQRSYCITHGELLSIVHLQSSTSTSFLRILQMLNQTNFFQTI